MSYNPQSGDSVFHKPSRETWLVKRVLGDRLEWCGWPPGTAQLSDCRITYVLIDAERQKWYDDFPSVRALNAA